jgi:peroxidase
MHTGSWNWYQSANAAALGQGCLVEHLNSDERFLQGCDGSVLLDDTVTMIGEKQADQNVNSLKGFELVDKIKEKLEAECPGTVSCADLLAIAARDAVVLVNKTTSIFQFPTL